MSTIEPVVYYCFDIGMVSTFIGLCLIIFISKRRVKGIDKAVLGFDFPRDSFFALAEGLPLSSLLSEGI